MAQREEEEVMARVVVQRPDWGDFACKWGSYWLQEVINEARTHGYDVSDLHANNARREKVLRECKKSDFVYFSGVGHGNATTFTGQRGEPIFWLGDQETKQISRGKHFNFLSCKFGRLGAKWMARRGRAVGVHAYTADFIFIADEDDFPNGYARPFFDSHLTVDRELLKGSTHGEAHRACIRRYLYWSMRAPSICRRYLIWNMIHKAFYGRRWADLRTTRACIVATATLGYGNEKLEAFHWLRDCVIDRRPLGKYIIDFYYYMSNLFVDAIFYNERLRRFVYKTIVNPAWVILEKIRRKDK
ncbi:MAG TPA: hypothetical protein ENG74_01910, partial [Thermoplasmatales archaeon]|nr:hypothetical protein [Thermoplasmatales archaeon]